MSEQTTTKPSLFERLSAINFSDKVEKKDNLTYLSWAWAWSAFKRECPEATYSIGETTYDEELGFMCHTSVTAEGITHSMWLPVMDGANKSMKKNPYKYEAWQWKNGTKTRVEKTVEAATTFDINKTLMRCLVKNLAMFGLGIYIYAGEDLPEVVAEPAPVAPPATSPIAEKPKRGSTKATSKAPEQAASEPNSAAGETQLPSLVLGTENWDRVKAYLSDPSNKAKGAEKAIAQVSRKYTIGAETKAEIEKIFAA